MLFDLAIKLEEPTNLPVDVEHVLAAIVLAARTGELSPKTPLSSDDPALVEVLMGHVKTVFEQFGGKVGKTNGIIIKHGNVSRGLIRQMHFVSLIDETG